MKTLLTLIVTVMMTVTAYSATVLQFNPYAKIIPNASGSLTAAEVVGGGLQQNLAELTAPWIAYGTSITADDGGLPQPIQQLTVFGIVIDANTPGSANTIPGAALVFGSASSAPTARAFDQFGNDITASAGLEGVNIMSDLTGKGVYEIVSANWKVGPTTFSGAHTIDTIGEVQSFSVSGTATVNGSSVVGSPAMATVTIIPEPSTVILLSLGLLGMVRRVRQ